MSAPHILLVDDEPSVLRYTKTLLELNKYQVEAVDSGEEALHRMNRGYAPNLVILDIVMRGMDGLQTLENCKRIRPEQKVVMMSCVNDTNKVVEAMKLGASDYLMKPFQEPQLKGAIERALQGVAGGASRAEAPERPAIIDELDEELFFLAASPSMKQLRSQANLIAKVDVPVLLLGESGVGKEVAARLIHKLSLRAHRPMLKVNCAALPAELLESELFGYEAGAFTGAGRSKPGRFEIAHKGTILLDEIGEMSAPLQAKLLQVLQDGQFCRLGGRSNVKVDTRILAATNIDVERAILDKTFREDLYYRLSAFTITIPPIRERREEIPLLLNQFMKRTAQKFGRNPVIFSDHFIQECVKYPWPGNLRELGNLVKRLLVLENEDLVLEEMQMKSRDFGSSASVTSGASAQGGLKALVRNLKDEAEAKEIQRALDRSCWNRKVAAEELNISYKALLYKIKQHNLSPAAGPGFRLGREQDKQLS